MLKFGVLVFPEKFGWRWTRMTWRMMQILIFPLFERDRKSFQACGDHYHPCPGLIKEQEPDSLVVAYPPMCKRLVQMGQCTRYRPVLGMWCVRLFWILELGGNFEKDEWDCSRKITCSFYRLELADIERVQSIRVKLEANNYLKKEKVHLAVTD